MDSSLWAAILAAAPQLAKQLLGPLAALDIAVRFKGKRLQVGLKDGSDLDGILIGQGLARGGHTLLIRDDQGDQHAVLRADVVTLVIRSDVRLSTKAPGRTELGLGLFLDGGFEDLQVLVEDVARTRSRVERRDVLPGLASLRLVDPPWESATIEIGEPLELMEPTPLAEPGPPITLDAVRIALDIPTATYGAVRVAVVRLLELRGDLEVRLKSAGRSATGFLYLGFETADHTGMSETGANLMKRINADVSPESAELLMGSDGTIVTQEQGRTSVVVTEPVERILRLLV